MSQEAQRIDEVSRTSWLPLTIVMMCQIQISFNAFNVSIQGIVEDLGIPAGSVGLALTTATFAMAGLVLLGGERWADHAELQSRALAWRHGSGSASIPCS